MVTFYSIVVVILGKNTI